MNILIRFLKSIDFFLKTFRIDFGIGPFWFMHLINKIQKFDLVLYYIFDRELLLENVVPNTARVRLTEFWNLKKMGYVSAKDSLLVYDLCEDAYLEMKDACLFDDVMEYTDKLSAFEKDKKVVSKAGVFLDIVEWFEDRQVLKPFFYTFLFCISFALGSAEGNFWLHWEFGLESMEKGEIFWTETFKPFHFDPRPVGSFNNHEFDVGIFGFPAFFFSLFILLIELQSSHYSSKTRFVAYLLVFYTFSLVLIQGFEPRLSAEEATEQIRILGLRNRDPDFLPQLTETVEELRVFFREHKIFWIDKYIGRDLPIKDPVAFYEYEVYLKGALYPFFGEADFINIMQWSNALIFFKCLNTRRIEFPIFKKVFLFYDEAEQHGFIPRWLPHSTRILTTDFDFLCRQSVLQYKWSLRRLVYFCLFFFVIFKILAYFWSVFLVIGTGKVPFTFFFLKLKILLVSLLCLVILLFLL